MVAVCGWQAGGGRRRKEGGADTTLKTKTPHVNVEKKRRPTTARLENRADTLPYPLSAPEGQAGLVEEEAPMARMKRNSGDKGHPENGRKTPTYAMERWGINSSGKERCPFKYLCLCYNVAALLGHLGALTGPAAPPSSFKVVHRSPSEWFGAHCDHAQRDRWSLR